MKKQIKIMVADDHELIHNGVSDCLQDSPEYVIAGHAFSGSEAIVMALKLKPDIILMDISMPDGNGIEATAKILQSQPGIKIIALSQYDSSEYVSQMLKAGSSGYLLKNSRKKEILAALDTVVNNRKYINPEMIHSIMSQNETPEREKPNLTKRELEILKKIADGFNNTEIAEYLNISVRTVETHRRNLMQKMEVNSVVDLLKQASKYRIINL